MHLGVCYYPEHWPQHMWADDAARMVQLGISHVRIGEFAWSRIEPQPGQWDWGWLDKAVETLSQAGLKIIMGTPTATPPKWLVDQMPDMLAVDASGQPRNFGSRRHYCFSHAGYRSECARIVTAMARRYGGHDSITAWQMDNEYGCHDTVLSYSDAAGTGFRRWLREKYDDISALNRAWGNIFWSQEYRDFDEIDPPLQTVTEANPAHRMDYRRFASDEVVAFNQLQAGIVRRHAPKADITHNYMGFFTEFDHYKVSGDIDIAGWDSYPLGFLEQFFFTEAEKNKYYAQGHPDIAAFHHDLYRGCIDGGRWWVAEQQPGPVNWARYNPAPLPGMVRLWTLEAMAHGAEILSYFRWRQAAFGQEQMHSGLHRSDNSPDVAAKEVQQAANDIAAIGPSLASTQTRQASVAMLFDYEASWMMQIQPQGKSSNYLEMAFRMYGALRRCGLDIDIVPRQADFTGYKMLIVPPLPSIDDDLSGRLAEFDGQILFGPRSGSKTADFQTPDGLPPGQLRDILPIRIVRVESLRSGVSLAAVAGGGIAFPVTRWLEHLEGDAEHLVSLKDGRPVVVRHKKLTYMAGWGDDALLEYLIRDMAQQAGLPVLQLPEGLVCRRLGDLLFAINYAATPVDLTTVWKDAAQFNYCVGAPQLAAADVAVWQQS